MNRSEAVEASRKYWWVNQGRAYTPQRDGGYIWAPQRSRGGTTFAHHRNVGLVSRGDVVLHYAKGTIRALGRVRADGGEGERPEGLSGDSWAKEGYLAAIEYLDLDNPIHLNEVDVAMRTSAEGGPFDVNGAVKQGYLFPLDDDLADQIRSQFLERWPGNSHWGGVTDTPALDPHQLDLLRTTFLARTPGFETFDPPRGPYRYWERDYKDETSNRVRNELVPLIREAPVDRANASEIIRTTQSIFKDRLASTGAPQNLISWRYYDFLAKLSDQQESRFAEMLRTLLLGTKDSSDRVEQFNHEFVELYRVAAGERPGAAITRSLPTLFLMLHNPSEEIFIRTRLFNRLSKKLTGNGLFTGKPLDAESYRRTVTFAHSVKTALADWGWKPVDMIDVQSFLWVSGTLSFQAQTSSWIFQANPKFYDIEGALRAGHRFGTYTVAQHRNKIRCGDRIYFWVSGKDSGIVGTGTVIEPPAKRQDFEWERPFYREDANRFAQSHIAVQFEVGGTISKRLTKAELMEDATLQNLTILRAPQGTNYSLTKEESDAIERLLRKMTTPEYFKIAPGKGAEFWEQCLTAGIMCVGWDELGDLRSYESVESLRAAMEEHYGADMKNHAPTIARTANRLWDFRNLQPGDRIVANRGTSEVLGVGDVGKAGYRWMPERDPFRNVVEVNWDTSAAGAIPDQGAPWRQTIVKITPELYDSIVSGVWPVEQGEGFEGLMSRFREAGLYFPAETVSNYLLALQAKGFVILTGISGTGKTGLAMHVARSFGAAVSGGTDDHLCLVPVRPDWTDNRGLLGWQNPITGKYVLTPALKFLLRAQAEVEGAQAKGRAPHPYFLVLDEMNIARVEYYFSDFLSCLESGMPLNLHDETSPDVMVPSELPIPHNVFITGTVNVDETTYTFSPKVLDRAFTIELNRVDLNQLGQPNLTASDKTPLYLRNLLPMIQDNRGEKRGATNLDWNEFKALQGGTLADVVDALNRMLTEENRHFGYRVATEIARFTNLAARQAGDDEENLWYALDLALMEKVLPKFHGTQQELEGILEKLFRFAITGSRSEQGSNIAEQWDIVGDELRPLVSANWDSSSLPRLPLMALKTLRMIRRLRQQGFTSFIQ